MYGGLMLQLNADVDAYAIGGMASYSGFAVRFSIIIMPQQSSCKIVTKREGVINTTQQ